MKSILAATCCLLLLCQCHPSQKNNTSTSGKAISSQDKKAIINLFAGADPNKYHLQFNKGQETYGSMRVQMSDLQQVSKFTNPGEKNGDIVLIVEDDGVIYILAVTGNNVASVIGEEKAQQLTAIMAKYSR